MILLEHLLPYLKRHRWLLTIGFVFVILKNLFQSMSPLVVREAIDSLSETPVGFFYVYVVEPMFGSSAIPGFVFCFLFFELLHAMFLYGMRRTLIVTSRRVEYDFRNDFFAHVQRLHAGFFQTTRTGDLMSRMNSDLGAVRDVLGPGIMYTANTIVSFIYVVQMMLSISPLLTGLAFLPLLLLSFLIQRLSGQIHVRSERVQEKLADISSRAQENFSGIRVVMSFVREAFEIERFRAMNRDYVRLNMGLVRVRGVMMASVILTMGLSVAVLLGLGGKLVMSDDISLGQFTAFSFYLAILIWPIIALGWVINIFQRGSASMKRIVEILQTEPLITDASAHPLHPAIRGQIEFRNLTFSYGDRPPVLHGISLRIDAGMTLAIVGATGSGKTTLVSLIPRIYDASPGMVQLDGQNIECYPLNVLRGSIGMVPQDTFLFSDTILNNLLFGIDGADAKTGLWASDIAQLTEAVQSFPDGYGTMIGERGITLSGGQKQRLAIARAVAKEPRILILDDALSSVDTRTEEAILVRMKELMRERTSIVVSHRLQTIQHADHIVLLDDGRIAEQGTHTELLARRGAYLRLYDRQQIEQELAET
jgi:ATP-binding cassette subfamily B protein